MSESSATHDRVTDDRVTHDRGTHHRVVIIGGGFAGIAAAVRLSEAGVDDLLILEKADRLGGTWRDNTYPGAACDVPSHLYSYSWDQPMWPRRYSHQGEILDYIDRVAADAGLDAKTRFGTTVDRLEWDEASSQWEILLDGGERLTADVAISAVGQLNRPALPDIAGQDSFHGPSWHSARWRHDVDLEGKVVAVIGTGASAVQIVPEVAKVASRVEVYQRTPPYVIPRNERVFEGLEKTILSKFPVTRKLDRARIFATGELLMASYINDKMSKFVEMKWQKAMSVIDDPDLRKKLTPEYRIGCKRICFSDDWYPALVRSNVDLVSEGIESVTPSGIRTADGKDHNVDVIVYATGFKSTEFLMPMEVVGRGGLELQEHWRKGASAYLGVTVGHFPNFFMLYGPNTNLGANSIIFMIESQVSYIVDAVRALEQQGLRWMEVRSDVQAEFNDWVAQKSSGITYGSGCRSWYLKDGRNTNNWPTFTYLYRRRLSRLDMLDYDVQPAVG